MSVYAPDMRVMRQVSQSGVYVSHASFKTERGAQNLCQKLLKRKPKANYTIRQIGAHWYVYCLYSV